MNLIKNLGRKFGKLFTPVLALTLGLGAVSCKDNDDQYDKPEVTISPEIPGNALNFPRTGGAQEFTIKTNRKWTVSNNTPWLDITPTSGDAGEYKVVVRALENSGNARTGAFTFVMGSLQKSFTVSQEVGEARPIEFAGMPLADFIARYTTNDPSGVVNDDVFFEAVVISDPTGGNSISKKNVILQAGEKGIVLRLNSGAAPAEWTAGSILRVKAQGAKVLRYNGGTLQIDFTGITDDLSKITATGNQGLITPKELTLAEIYSGQYENILVSVDGVQLNDASGNLYSGTATAVYPVLTDCATQEPQGYSKLSLGISKFAKFKDEAKPQGNGKVTGILSYSKIAGGTINAYSIWPRTMQDLSLNGARCSSNSGGTVTPPDPNAAGAISLQDFITRYNPTGETGVTVTDEVYFEASLISSGDNSASKKNIVVQSGEKGISIRLNIDKPADWTVGKVLRVNAQGAKVSLYKGNQLQLDFTGVANTTAVALTGATQEISPKSISLSDIYSGQYENILVSVDGVQFEDASGVLNGGQQYSPITDCVTDTPSGFDKISIAINKYAPFKGEAKPQGNGKVTGVLIASGTSVGKTYSIWPRSAAEIAFNGDRCTADNTGNSGTVTPPTPPVVSTGEPLISLYYEGKSFDKYIQLYNPTEQPIDLSLYKLKMDVYSGKTHKASAGQEVTLSGTLEAHSVVAFRNAKASVETNIQALDIVNWNGDDNIALYKGDQIIDVVGTWGSAWLNGSVSAGMDKALIRKASITQPNATFTPAEWDEVPYSSYTVTDAIATTRASL